MTDEQPNYLIVHTAKQLPSYLPWVTYALIVVNTYVADTGNNWYLYSVAAIAGGMTYCFYNTYHALVSLYNDMRVSAAIAQVKMEVPVASDSEKRASKADESTVLSRYWDTLTWINSNSDCKDLGAARDACWRALDHDDIQASLKEHTDGDDKETSDEVS